MTIPQRPITTLPGMALVIANMIGMGVFVSIGFQAGPLPDPWLILGLWLAGAVLSLLGALSYVELGLTLPRSGGEYHFLRKLYGSYWGIYGGLVSLLWGFAAPVAIAAVTAGRYAEQLWPGIEGRYVGVGMVALVTLMHAFDLRVGARLHTLATAFKVALILAFITAGFWAKDLPGLPVGEPLLWDGPLWASLAVALIYVMYAYSGWNAAVYVIDEMEEPRRTLPRALLGGTAVVGVLYLVLNFVFLRSATLGELSEAGGAAAYVSAGHIFGGQGGKWMAGLIMLGLIATMSAMTWAGPRVGHAMGEDMKVFRWLAWRTRQGVPLRALLFQSSVAMILVWPDRLRETLEGTMVVLGFASLLTVAGVFLLRRKGLLAKGAKRSWGYPFAPALFLLVTASSIGYVLWTSILAAVKGGSWMVALAFLLPFVLAGIFRMGDRRA